MCHYSTLSNLCIFHNKYNIPCQLIYPNLQKPENKIQINNYWKNINSPCDKSFTTLTKIPILRRYTNLRRFLTEFCINWDPTYMYIKEKIILLSISFRQDVILKSRSSLPLHPYPFLFLPPDEQYLIFSKDAHLCKVDTIVNKTNFPILYLLSTFQQVYTHSVAQNNYK